MNPLLSFRYRLPTLSRFSGLAVAGIGVFLLAIQQSTTGPADLDLARAVAFVASGLALYLLHPDTESPRRRRLGYVFASCVCLVGGASLISFGLGRNVEIDRGIIASPAVSVSFLLFGIALLLLGGNRLPALTHGLLLAMVGINAFRLVGYLYGIPSPLGGSFDHGPLPTGSLLLVLGVGALHARPERGLLSILSSDGAGGAVARRLLPASVVVPVLFGWLRLEGQRADWFGTEIGLSLFALSNVACFSALVFWVTTSLQRSDSLRERAERAHRESEDRFHHLTDSLPQIVWAANNEGRSTYLNNRWAEYTGLTGAAPDESAQVIHPSDLAVIEATWLSARKSGDAFQAEFRLRPATGGSYRWFLARGVAVRGAGGEIREWLGTSTDIDDLKHIEEALQQSQKHFRMLAESLPQFVWTDRADGACDYLSPQWVDYTGIPEAEQLGFGWIQQVHPDDRAPAEAAWFRAVEGGTTLETEFRIRRADGEYRWFQTRAVALRDESGAVVKWFGTNTDIEDHKQARAALERSRAMLQLVLDTIPQGVFWKDRNSRYLGCNRVVARAMGLSDPAEITGLTDAGHLSMTPEEADKFVLEDREVMDADTPRFHIIEQMTLADSTTIWLDTNKVPMHDDRGQVIGVLGTWEDISERRRAEQELQEKGERLREADRRLGEIVQGMSEACFALDSQWRFTFVNHRCEMLFPHQNEAMMGRSIWEVFGKLVGTPTEQNYRRAMAERVPITFEAFSPIAQRWLDIRLFPSGEGLAAFLLDISERKRVDEERQKFVAMADSSQEFIGMANRDFEPTYVNAAGRRLIGFPELGSPGVRVQDCFFPEDQAFITDEFFPRVLRDGHAEVEIRFRHFLTQQPIWMIYNVFNIKDSTGEIVGWATVSRNINDRKRAESALRESEARFHRTFDSMLEGCQIIGPDWRYLYVNDSIAAHARRTREELIGRTMMEVYPGIDETEVFGILRECMEERTTHRIENRFVYPDGHSAWFDLSIQAGPEGIFVLSADITDRKRAEENFLRLAKLIEHSRDFISLADLDGRLLFLNSGARQMIGVSDDADISAIKFTDYVPPNWQHTFRDTVIRTALDQGQWQGEMQLCHLQTGALVDVHRSTFVIRDVDGQGGYFASVTRDITEQKRAEQSLRESESRFRSAFEHTNVAMVLTDMDNRFVRVNAEFARMFGYAEAEMLRMSMADITHPDDLVESYARREELLLRDTNHFVMEKRYLNHAGRVIWGLTNVSLLRDPDGQPLQYVGQVQDITERKRTEEALRDSAARFHALADSIPQLCWMANAEGHIFWYNERWYEYTGKTPQEMGGSGWQSVHDPEVLPKVVERRQASIASGEPFEMVFPLKGADGRFRPFLTRIMPLSDEEGGVLQWFGTSTDITEERRSAEELEHRVTERTAQLEAANKELEAFSYSVSHDLRAPLRAIDGFSRIVMDDFGANLPPDALEYLRDVRANTKQMGRLVDDLLAFSRLSRMPVARQTFSVVDLVGVCLDELRPATAGRQVDIRVGDLAECQADPSLLKQVWLNLLANALKYSGKRETAIVEIGSLSEAEGTTYFVRDNGVGFEMRYAHKLFGVFQRLHRAEEYEGTGVGLAIVQRIIHRHEGRVWAESAPGRGATFFFTLPSI